MANTIDESFKNFEEPFNSSKNDPYHKVFSNFIERVNQTKGATILELGSRNVSGNTRNNLFNNYKNYIGFDILEGPNVDKVGDVHKLSQYFQPNSIDFVYCISVFEHLMMPWKAVLEINKVMKTGGEIYISTHPTWSPHELPWDFFRFLHNSAHSLFNPHTGFEVVEVVEGLPCRIVSLVDDPPTRGLKYQPTNLGIGIRAKKIREHSEKLKWDIYPEDINDTMYPSKSGKKPKNPNLISKIQKLLGR